MTAVVEVWTARRRPGFTVAVWAWTVFLLSIHAVLSVLALPITLLFDRDRRASARLGAWLTRTALHMPRKWRGAAHGLDSIRLSGPTVVVMNHRSLADIAIAVGVPGGPKIVSKPWVGRVPLLGWCMRLCGHVILDPESPAAVREAMARLEGLLRRGNSVLFFPEGTRGTGPGLGRFHEGAFSLAVATGAVVLPVVLHATGELVPKGTLVFHDVEVDVTPLDPVPPGDDRSVLARCVRDAMAASLAAHD